MTWAHAWAGWSAVLIIATLYGPSRVSAKHDSRVTETGWSGTVGWETWPQAWAGVRCMGATCMGRWWGGWGVTWAAVEREIEREKECVCV